MTLNKLGPCRLLLGVALLAAPLGCVEAVTAAPSPAEDDLDIGQSRTVELRFLRFDVNGFKQTLTLDDLRALPQRVLDETWLLDLPMTPFVENALAQVSATPPVEAYAMPPASTNLWRLLNMTPANANLDGTSLEGLLGVGEAVGLAPSKVLADLVGIGENDPLVSTGVTAQAVMDNVVGTHPNAAVRRGPVNAEHPDGLYPVALRSIPVTLADVVSDFAGLADRYGPAPLDPDDPGAGVHPGFIVDASPIQAAEDDFTMTVTVNINAMPYKGVDATIAGVATVNSTGSQIEGIFDFSDPSWLAVEGLSPDLRIESLTMGIQENEGYLPGGTSRDPLPTGDSPVWATPPWELEHLLASAGRLAAGDVGAHCSAYGPEGSSGNPFEAVEVCIDDTAWTEISVDPSVVLDEPPPPPSYYWDVLLEVAQVRLHDGGIPEGGADLMLSVHDVPVGVTPEELVAQIRANTEKDPRGMLGIAEQLNDNTAGDADFYYYQPTAGGAPAMGGDYLYFIVPHDLRKDEEGAPVRSYNYMRPGFFADAELTEKVSTTEEIDGDSDHEKVKIEPGMRLYMEDDAQRRYAIIVGEKPSAHRIALTLKRIQ